MSDIRFNQWLHQSGTGGVSQVASGAVGVGTTNPLADFYVRGDAQITGILTAGHIAMGSSITFGDNDRIYLGDGTDFQLYHASSDNNSYIVESGAGSLVVNASKLHVKNAANNEDVAVFNQSGNNELYFSNSKKFETTNTGAVVTGILTATNRIQATSLRIANTNFSAAGNADELILGDTSGNRGLTIVSGNTGIGALFFADDGSTNVGSLVYEHNTNQMRMNVAGAQIMRLDYTSSIPTWIIGNDLNTHISRPSADTFAFTTGGTERLRITSGGSVYAGNIGVGTDNRWKIRANNSYTELAFEYSTSTSLADSNIKMIIDPDGDVGIGDNSPNIRLTVVDTGTENLVRLGRSDGSSHGSHTVNVKAAKDYYHQFQMEASGYQLRAYDGSNMIEVFKVLNTGFAELAGASDVRLTLGSAGTAGSNSANWVRGNGNNLYYNAAVSDHLWEIAGAEHMRLRNDGNLYLRSENANYVVLGSSGSNTSGGVTNSMNWIRGNGTNTQYNCNGGFHAWEVSGSERLRIASDGAITLQAALTGNTALSYLRNTRTRASGNKYGIEFRDSSNEANANIVIQQNSSGNNAAEMKFFVNGGTGGNGLENGNHALKLKQNGEVELPDGNLIFASGHGIDFSAVSNGQGGTSILDDYEEGSLTLTLVGQYGGSVSYSYRTGRYVKVGSLVHVTGDIRLSGSWSGSSGNLYMQLPFTSFSSGGTVGNGIVAEWNLSNSNWDNIMMQVDNNVANAKFTSHSGSNNNTSYLQTGELGNGRWLKFGLTYHTHL